ncbi:MAG: ATP-dependent Clp protease adaptor ClpS [Calditrichaeota bacterium]|nr:MAG: ATP-dependent Clp protease adaptor ClpS [Calditrichota bacterium]
MFADRPDTNLEEAEKTCVAHIPRYNVVLWDDNDNTYDYVIEMITSLFGHSTETAFKMACEVDAEGRVIVDITSKERAEFKRDQIHAYGCDWRIERCQGSMNATIEPVDDENET